MAESGTETSPIFIDYRKFETVEFGNWFRGQISAEEIHHNPTVRVKMD